MAKTYEDMRDEIKRIMEQAEKLCVVEVVIHEVCKKIKAYNLDAKELGLADKIIKAQKNSEKFRDPITGNTWSGRGTTPNWIKKSGKSKEEFRI